MNYILIEIDEIEVKNRLFNGGIVYAVCLSTGYVVNLRHQSIEEIERLIKSRESMELHFIVYGLK